MVRSLYESWRRAARGAGAAALAAALAAGAGAGAGVLQEPAERAVKARLAPESLLLDVAAGAGVLVAVGERGHVLVSHDGGSSWRQADVPSRVLLTGVFMHDAQVGWAVGHDEVVIRTRDGGLTWALVHHAPEHERPLLDVWFADALHGLAVGAYGGMLATEDGGETWAARSVHGEDDFHLNHIAAAGDGALYLAAEAGHLYRSDDRGDSWRPLPSPYEGSYFGLQPLSDGTLLAFGLRGHLYRSADRGATWTRLETGTEETLTFALELQGGRFVVAGMAGTLLWGSADGTVRRQELPGRRAIAALAPAGTGRLLVVGEGGAQTVEIRP